MVLIQNFQYGLSIHGPQDHQCNINISYVFVMAIRKGVPLTLYCLNMTHGHQPF